jgi:predicted nucleotidyltransferase
MDRLAVRYDQRLDEERLAAALAAYRTYDPAMQVFLFGSRAGEAYLDASDWDLLCVSDAFANQPFLARSAELAWSLAESGFAAVDLVCLTPAELSCRMAESSAFAAATARARRLL